MKEIEKILPIPTRYCSHQFSSIFLNNFTSYKYKALTAPVIAPMMEKFRGSFLIKIMAIGPNF